MEEARRFAAPRWTPVAERAVTGAPVATRQVVSSHAEDEEVVGRVIYREPTFLRLMAGLIYFYFGFLKFFPDLSPAELIASEAIMRVSDHRLDATSSLLAIAIMEVAIGLSLLFKFQLRWMFYLFLVHQFSTFLPLFIVPELTFKIAPFAPTMEGQYIFKNLISLAAGLTVMLPAVRAEAAGNAARRRARTSSAPHALRLQR